MNSLAPVVTAVRAETASIRSKAGDVVRVLPPENRLALRMDAGEIVLLAGGIGITPLLAMAPALNATARPFRIVYAGRSHDQLALLSEPTAPARADLAIHADDRSGLLDVTGLTHSLGDDGMLFRRGPGRFRDLRRTDRCRSRHGVRGRARRPGPSPFHRSRPDDPSFPPRGGRRGDVRLRTRRLRHVQMRVIEGIPDRRDCYLRNAERASDMLIQVCVSRSKTPVLVLEARA